MTSFAHLIHAMYTSTHTVNWPSLPKECDVDPVCKAVCTLSSTSYKICSDCEPLQ